MWLFKRGFLLKKEAFLYDSPLYILKSFLSIFTAYILFSKNQYIGKDMISVLFGLMLTIEPVTISGIRSGWDQIKASVLGGVVTALLVYYFNVNAITVPLAVALTLYISLVIDWKNVSAVAIFTAIYMTQYVQFNAFGEPSMFLTFRLRMLALGSGVLVAIFYNYLFSLFFYKSMIQKRMAYILYTISDKFESLKPNIELEALRDLKREVSLLFSDIDFLFSHLSDMKKERHSKKKVSPYFESILELRDLNHYLLDVIQNKINHIEDKTALADLSVYSEPIRTMAEHLERKEGYESELIFDGHHHQSDNIQKTIKRLMESLAKAQSK